MEKIGLLGPLGTFTEEAAIKYCDDCEMVPYRTISEVFRAVENGEISKGVVPIENFLNGHVMETLDNLYRSGLKIEKAIVLSIQHCLAVGGDACTQGVPSASGKVKENSKKEKYYVLEMFPYPSASGLHMGHALNYTKIGRAHV